MSTEEEQTRISKLDNFDLSDNDKVDKLIEENNMSLCVSNLLQCNKNKFHRLCSYIHHIFFGH